ncbi:MAG: ABC transporter substrate-binding protein, partial [Gordonia amarae]
MTARPRRIVVRLLALVVVAVTGAGLVTACSKDDRPPTIDYIVDAGLTTYNANTVSGNADGALMALTRVLPGFSLLGDQGQVMPDRDVGTVTAISQAPLTLRYTFTPEAVFSDGTPLD